MRLPIGRATVTTKEQVLRVLEDNQGSHVSGADIAQTLGISRNAIWKAINALRTEGYSISAATNKGYALSRENDLISPQSIERHLPARHPFTLSVRKRVDSTNAEGRRRALEGAPEGTVVIAEEQTEGRGRRGNSFYSPPLTGLYLSIILRPNLLADQAQYITTAAAVAVAQAIEETFGRPASIKWVNDVYCEGRKVSGILTEATLDMESGQVEHAVLGIGVNVKVPEGGFPDELSSIAGVVSDEGAGAARNKLAASILTHFWTLYENIEERAYFDEYRRRCFLIGQPIVIENDSSRVRAKAVDLTRDFKLVVELPDKTTKELPYGRVHVSNG